MAVPDNSKSPYRARSTDAGNLSTDFFGPCVCWRTDNPVGLAKVIRQGWDEEPSHMSGLPDAVIVSGLLFGLFLSAAWAGFLGYGFFKLVELVF